MRLLIATKEFDAVVTGVAYCYADRRNGWYAYAHNAAGDQIGPAHYQWRKDDVLAEAEWLAKEYGGVPVARL